MGYVVIQAERWSEVATYPSGKRAFSATLTDASPEQGGKRNWSVPGSDSSSNIGIKAAVIVVYSDRVGESARIERGRRALFIDRDGRGEHGPDERYGAERASDHARHDSIGHEHPHLYRLPREHARVIVYESQCGIIER